MKTKFLLTQAILFLITATVFGQVDVPLEKQDSPPAAPEAPSPVESNEPWSDSDWDHSRDRFQLGNDLLINKGEVARDAVVVGSSLIVKGRVRGDAVAVAGSAEVEGEVSRDVVVVGGSLTLRSNAVVGGDVVVIGGMLEREPGAVISGSQNVHSLGLGFLNAGWLREWLRQCLLLGRPIAPSVFWTMAGTGVLLLLYLIIAVLFPRPVAACVEGLSGHPGTAFLAGVLTLILFLPAIVLLVISAVGILVIPVLLAGLLIAALLGKVAVYRYIAEQLLRQVGVRNFPPPLVSFLIGALLITALLMVPFIGFVVWGLTLVLALGSVCLAVLSVFQKTSTPGSEPPGIVLKPGPGSPAGFNEGSTLAPLAPPAEAGTFQLASGKALPRAGFWIRLAATLLDAIILIILTIPLGHPFITLLIWVAYHIAMWTWKGTTIGGIVVGIKTVRLDGQDVTFPVALVRSLASFFSALALFLGFFWAGWDRDKQSWHDKIAGTTKVRLPRGFSLI